MGDKGAALTLWSHQVKVLLGDCSKVPELASVVAPLAALAGELEAATGFIVSNAAKTPDVIGAASMPYMQLMGIASLGWMWLRMAKTAVEALANGSDDRAFYQAKLNTAQFYMQYWAVQGHSLRQQVEAASHGIMNFPDSDF